MARPKKLENMSAAELAAMEARIERLKIDKQNAERAAVREKMIAIARQHGFDIRDLLDGRKGKRGKVAVKYRDRAGNTWTGRGRMPRWLVAATKGGRKRKTSWSPDPGVSGGGETNPTASAAMPRQFHRSCVVQPKRALVSAQGHMSRGVKTGTGSAFCRQSSSSPSSSADPYPLR